MVGYLLKKITGRKLVLNFSDPLTLNAYSSFDRNSLRARIDFFLERIVIREADRIVFASHYAQLDYEQEYPGESDKFCTIINGYDPDEFKQIRSYGTNEKFILTYCGSLQYFRSPEPFLKALEGLIDRCPEYLSTLLVRFVGKIDSENSSYFDSFKHKAVLHITGQVSYEKSMEYVFLSDACLLIGGTERWEMPGKAFEYMAARKPILVISYENQVADLVKN